MKEQEAYKIMYRFLDDRYNRLPSNELGSLMGELHLATDGLPFDPAVAEDWNRAVTSVQQQTRPTIVEVQRRAS